jgi:hypothetical protein
MTQWSPKNLHPHMHVYAADNQDVGHIAHLYEDSFLVEKGLLFTKDRYIPYSAITSVTDNQVHLSMSTAELSAMKWEKRPDYEDHLGDPTQLMYDRGHGVHDPFDETSPDNA